MKPKGVTGRYVMPYGALGGHRALKGARGSRKKPYGTIQIYRKA